MKTRYSDYLENEKPVSKRNTTSPATRRKKWNDDVDKIKRSHGSGSAVFGGIGALAIMVAGEASGRNEKAAHELIESYRPLVNPESEDYDITGTAANAGTLMGEFFGKHIFLSLAFVAWIVPASVLQASDSSGGLKARPDIELKQNEVGSMSVKDESGGLHGVKLFSLDGQVSIMIYEKGTLSRVIDLRTGKQIHTTFVHEDGLKWHVMDLDRDGVPDLRECYDVSPMRMEIFEEGKFRPAKKGEKIRADGISPKGEDPDQISEKDK